MKTNHRGYYPIPPSGGDMTAAAYYATINPCFRAFLLGFGGQSIGSNYEHIYPKSRHIAP
jgi:hypothetical protein